MNLKDKESEIKDLLNEMSIKNVKQNGFTDLFIRGFIKNNYQENVDRWGSDRGYKTIITEKINKTSLVTFGDRFNDICLEKTFVKDGILNLVYNGYKEATISIDSINRIFIMRKGDSRVY